MILLAEEENNFFSIIQIECEQQVTTRTTMHCRDWPGDDETARLFMSAKCKNIAFCDTLYTVMAYPGKNTNTIRVCVGLVIGNFTSHYNESVLQ